MNKQTIKTLKRLYNHIGDYTDYTTEEFEETVKNDWKHGYLTDHMGNDGGYYFWYKDECKSVAIRVDDGEIFTDEKEICNIIGIHYDDKKDC